MSIDHDLLDKTLHKIETLEAFKAEGVFLEVGWHQGDWGTDWELQVKRAERWVRDTRARLRESTSEYDRRQLERDLEDNLDTLELYRQKLNHCKTAFCFAGHVAVDNPNVQFVENSDGSLQFSALIDENGKRRTTAEWAAEKLGLSEDTADILFSGTNDLEELRDQVERIHRRAGKL